MNDGAGYLFGLLLAACSGVVVGVVLALLSCAV